MKVIAEIGTNWVREGTPALTDLLASVRVAAQVGAQGVKFQVGLETLYSWRRAPTLAKALLPYAIPPRWLQEARDEADKQGIELWASVFSVDKVETSAPLLHGLKIASGDMVYGKLVAAGAKAACKYDIPLCISTGAALPKEIETLFTNLAMYLPLNLILMHCVSDYPADETKVDLLAGIANLSRDEVTELGFSDHTKGNLAAQLALGAGYTIFEKHLNPFGDLEAPDAKVAIMPEEFIEYVQKLHYAEIVLGSYTHQLTKNELTERQWARRGEDTLRPVDGVKEK